MKRHCLALLFWLGFFQLTHGQTNNPTHEGKTVKEWFRVYVNGAGTRPPANFHSVRNGEFFLLPTMKLEADPAWSAFQNFGANAVPFLTQKLSVRTNETAQIQLERRQAVELLHRLGPCARASGPALLALLPAATEQLNEEICGAVHAVHTDAQLITQFLLHSPSTQGAAQFIGFAERLGWSGAEVAQRLGATLTSTNRELAQAAMTLLQNAGVGAAPAVDQIVAALQSKDQELRYLAVRCLAGPLTNAPAARQALRGVAEDANPMVRNVARRTLGLGP